MPLPGILLDIVMKGKYLYGITGGEVQLDFSAKGLFNKSPYLINYNGISAIVSDAPLKTYEADADALLSHNRVLDEVVKAYTVLPMRFGTIARSEDEVKSLLENAYPLLKERLLKIRNMVEFNMEINLADEKSLINEIVNNDNQIRDFRNKLLSQGKDAKIEDKLLIGRMVAEKAADCKNSLIKAIDTGLKPYYAKTKLLAKKDALVSSAYLVARKKIKEFESEIYKLGDRFADKLKFKYAGPLAPYSFVEIKLILINFEKLDNARRELKLAEEVSFKDIKTAYRKLANEYHPDRGHDKSKEEEFKKIIISYKLLYEYCRRYPKSHYVFKPEEINEVSVMVSHGW